MKNKGYLLDTSVLIWAMEKNPRLKPELISLLENPEVLVFVSVASIWEIVVKREKTPLKVPKNIVKSIKNVNFQILPIESDHVMEIERLSSYHNDPFDRMLISQARAEKLTLISSDKKIGKYKVKLLKV